MVTGAANTGAAIGAGFAVRQGDQTAVDGVGLDVEALRQLSPFEQTQVIVDTVFGVASDEMEYAGREAAATILLGFFESDESATEPDYGQILRDGVTEYVFRRAVVELADQLAGGVVDRDQAQELERQMRDYVRDRVTLDPEMNPTAGPPSAATCARVVADATAAVVATLREPQA